MPKRSKSKSHKRRKLKPREIARIRAIRANMQQKVQLKAFQIPEAMVNHTCDLALLSMLKMFGVSSQSLLEVMMPMVMDQLKAAGRSGGLEIPIGPGISLGYPVPEE